MEPLCFTAAASYRARSIADVEMACVISLIMPAQRLQQPIQSVQCL